jgi:hypothetical protein
MLAGITMRQPLSMLLPFLAIACGAETPLLVTDLGPADASGTVPDSGGGDGGRDAGDDGGSPGVDAMLPLPTLAPTYDGGGMALGCAPDNGEPAAGDAGTPFAACTFVDSQACTGDAECGCGCACQCGVCNCNVTAEVGTCAPGVACCSNEADCGPSCYGLACVDSQCVPSGDDPWDGTWEGEFSWPSTLSSASCDTGISPSTSSGETGGPMTVIVTGLGGQRTFLLKSQQGSGQALCSLPFLVTGDTATLVPGSTCVTPGLGNFCSNGPPSAAIQTFYSGSASLEGGALTLQTHDVFVEPASSGPECETVPAGLDQVNVESLMVTLKRVGDAG